jgi:dolichol-phosphate mannosyltransferase
MTNTRESNFLSAVIYIHNDERTVTEFLSKLYAEVDAHFEKYEIICVNDASTDNSVPSVKAFAAEHPDVCISILNMSYFQGVEMSMNAGTDLAIGDFVFEFDNAIMDYPTELIMNVYFHSLKGFDIVAAHNGNRRFSSNIFYRLYNATSDTQYSLVSETFCLLSRRAINRIHAINRTVPYRKALYANCGLKNDTILYAPLPKNGMDKKKFTKLQRKRRYDLAFNALILFTDVAYKAAFIMTVLFMFTAFGIGIYTVAVFVVGHPVEGFTTTMLVMTGSFFGVFAILAVIIKYLSVIIDLVFRRQEYMIESIDKTNNMMPVDH